VDKSRTAYPLWRVAAARLKKMYWYEDFFSLFPSWRFPSLPAICLRTCATLQFQRSSVPEPYETDVSWRSRRNSADLLSFACRVRNSIGNLAAQADGEPRCSPQPKAGMARRAYADGSGPFQPFG